MARTTFTDIIGFALAAIGILIFGYYGLTANISTDIGAGFFAFFLIASGIGAVYFGHKIWLS